jgi:hypothetical protein
MTDLTKWSEEQLELEAQRVAERRLAYAGATLYHDEQEIDPEEEFKGEELAGPYCGCDTCMVREALDAAYPFLAELGRREVTPEVMTPEGKPVNRCSNCHRTLPRAWTSHLCARCAPVKDSGLRGAR